MTDEILFLCHRLPYPPNKGDKIRSHAVLRHLAGRARVHLACFIDDPADRVHEAAVRDLAGGECLFVGLGRALRTARALAALATGAPITTACFYSKRIADWLARLVRARALDQAVVFSSAMAPYVLREEGLDPARSVLDMVDVDSDKWRQYARTASPLKRWIYAREADTLGRLEAAAAERFGATLLVSDYEARTLAGLVPRAAGRIHGIPNGVDLARFSPDPRLPNPYPPGVIPIVMTGMMDYLPNVDGAAWFAAEIMPRIAERLPDARFYLVGANPGLAVRGLARDNITVVGRVPDTRPYLQYASCAVAPLRIARGVQNKVLEAMAMCRPVVSTWEAARALAVTDGVELRIENEPARFAAAVVGAVERPDGQDMGAAGRRYVERQHDWQVNLAALDRLLADLARDRSPSRALAGPVP